MPAVTGTTLAQDAFELLNVFLPGEAIPPADGEKVRRSLNDILSEWSLRTAFIPFISRNTYPMVSGQGGPTFPYTIGPTGQFVFSPRPPAQKSLVSANLVLTTSVPTVRIPLGIYTNDAYNANAIPDLANLQPTGLYYNPTYANDLGSIFLWPVPSVNYNLLELFIQQAVAQFADLSTTYYVPDGYPRALKYAVADDLQTTYGKQLSAAAQRIALSSVSVIKRANWSQLSDLMNDASSWTGNRNTFYNIVTGNGGA
jgi:hypothetical protein